MKINEKLEHFASNINGDVNEKRNVILKEIEENYQREYSKKETEFLTTAYEIIQEGLKKIDKEKNEIMSTTMMENKVKLLDRRNKIINNVLDMTKLKLAEFVKSDEYHDYLISMINLNVELIGEGDLVITINHLDQKYKDEISEKYNCEVQLESEKIEMIGGCKILNITRNIFIDDSFSKRLEAEREDFIRDCKINIEL